MFNGTNGVMEFNKGMETQCHKKIHFIEKRGF